MGTSTTSLKQFLKNLCHHLQWDYAVFWKLNHRSRMLLTWEDGYCNHQQPRQFVEGISHNIFGGTTGVESFDYNVNESNGIHPVELAVASMSCLVYSFGEGYVGRVASTGNSCWIFCDDFDSNLVPEYPDELHLQFAVGIKTILLVPVIPHGVVQLGSSQKVNENPALAAHIRDMFNTCQCNIGDSMLSTLDRALPGPSSSVRSSLLGGETSTSSSNITIPVQAKVERKNELALDDIQLTYNKLSECISDTKFQFIGQNNLHVQGNNIDNTMDTEFGDLLIGCGALPLLHNQFPNCNWLTMMEPDAPNFSFEEENLLFSSLCDSAELRFAAQSNMGTNVYPFHEMMDQQFEVTDEMIYQTPSHGFLNFPTDSELQKSFGSVLQETEYPQNPNVPSEDVSIGSTSIYHANFLGANEPSVTESRGLTVKGDDANNLFDAMLSSMYDAADDISSTRSNSLSSGHIAASCQTKSRSTCSVFGENDSGPHNSVKNDFVLTHKNNRTRSPSKSSFKSTHSGLIDQEQQKGFGCTQSKRSTKVSQNGHKKVRNSDVQRPRPRDRQMIQDRVKELRELVPNSAKCSIDSLLDQTIKHMLFLRNVTNRAEKLKKCVYPEAVDRRNLKSSEKERPENGASWAFEMGSQFGACPIVVKDLDQPGHMLIEMLCEENGLFLEIAQVIRGLELTILKGVIENRSDKSWAHFIVEVSTGFCRMDIFWPLMQLLQRNSSVARII